MQYINIAGVQIVNFMLLSFHNHTIQEHCENFDLCKENYGNEIAMRIFQRIGEFSTAENLAELLRLPSINIQNHETENLAYVVNLTTNSNLLINLRHKLQVPYSKNDFISEVEIAKILF